MQSMTFGGGRDPVLVDMIARWVIAMPYVLKAHVTEAKDLSVQLEVRAELRVMHLQKVYRREEDYK